MITATSPTVLISPRQQQEYRRRQQQEYAALKTQHEYAALQTQHGYAALKAQQAQYPRKMTEEEYQRRVEQERFFEQQRQLEMIEQQRRVAEQAEAERRAQQAEIDSRTAELARLERSQRRQEQEARQAARTKLLSSLCRKFSDVIGKYRILNIIGEGAYGTVCSAEHRETGKKVAIKKIVPFDHAMFCIRTLREMKLLSHFSQFDANVSDNIIGILDVMKPQGIERFNAVFIVQELMETDLHRVIKTQPLSDDHCQYFVYQMLRGLKVLHSADIIHRDLKPSNLLLNANCDLRICDFGLARSIQTAENAPGSGATGFMTEYVATRWYRAPEIMLSFKQYTKAIDVWSVGCILAEMLNRKALFPGRDYHDQLTMILKVLGSPAPDDFHEITSKRSREYIRSLPFFKRKSFKDLFPRASPQALDFLERTLTFSPKKRLSVDQALAHPYLAAYHDPDDEPSIPPLPTTFFHFDLYKDDLSPEHLKVMLYDEVVNFKSVI